MTNEAEVYFALYGSDFDPDEVTRHVGLEPTTIRRKASPTPKHSWWIVSSGKIENDVIDVYEMANALVGQLTPHAEAIANVKQRLHLEAVLEVVLSITTDESKSTPAIGFDAKVIAFLSTVDASIDVDTYRNVP